MSTWNLNILYTSLDDPTLQEDFGKLEQMIAENAELAKAPISKENLETALLKNLNLTDVPFREDLPPAALHWMIADRKRSIVVESTKEGLQVYENPVGVLTNNPPFPFHLKNLHQYLNLTAEEPENRFSEELQLQPFSRGMGAIGLPGDWSAVSRFIRSAFVRAQSV